ncbi:nitroreductase family protein [Saccharopolyspora sp. 5N708]|uniref:nitroreductase family protein n=1 Tax=Saccharopolyspora sp. 5N708 TaxID=3457424 RepID=UPI003FD0CFDD
MPFTWKIRSFGVDEAGLGVAGEGFGGGCVAQRIMLAAHLLGLGSCPVTFFWAENAERVTAIVGYPHPWQVRTVIALGYPARTPTGLPAIPTGRHPLNALWTFWRRSSPRAAPFG